MDRRARYGPRMRHHSAMVPLPGRAFRGVRSPGVACLLLATLAAGQGVVKCVDAEGQRHLPGPPCTAGQRGAASSCPRPRRARTRAHGKPRRGGARDPRDAQALGAARARRAARDPAGGSTRGRDRSVALRGKDGTATSSDLPGPNVAWVRDDAGPVPAPQGAGRRPRATPAAAAAPRSRGAGRAEPASFVLPGRYCEHVFAEIGAADREERRLRGRRRRRAAAAPAASATSTSPAPAIRRCAPCSAASTAGSPTSSEPSCGDGVRPY